MAEKTKTLDISTTIDRVSIKVDGKAYEMRSDSELSLEEAHYLGAQGRKLNELMSKDKLDQNQKATLAGIADNITGTVMVNFDAQLEKLSGLQKIQIVNFFMERAEIIKAM